MAMAGPRRREKWGLDPRGTNWSKDQNKFGFKMLEKMGWSDGKGLGMNLDGGTDHVKVKTKNNTLGIGASSQDVDYNWLQTQDTFNTLLKDLNQACGSSEGAMPTGPPPDKLMERPTQKRKRGARMAMFEARFRKSKDTSIMGDDDLACILGADTQRPERLTEKGKTPAQPVKKDESEEEEEEEFKTVTNKQSMGDYFANLKAKSMGVSVPAPETATTTTETSTSEKTTKKKKKKSKKDKRKREDDAAEDDSKPVVVASDKAVPSPETATATETETSEKKTKKKKKKSKKDKRKREDDDAAEDVEDDSKPVVIASDKAVKKKKKKAKKSKKSEA